MRVLTSGRAVEIHRARSQLSALVSTAERGVSTTIMRRGKPVAMLVPASAARRQRPSDRHSFAELLLAYPGGIEFERDRTPMRTNFADPADLPVD